MDNDESLLEFPCDFPIKAFGADDGEFEAAVVELVRAHAPDAAIEAVHSRTSRAGTYRSVTVNVRATSRDQLDAIYHALTADERVLMAL